MHTSHPRALSVLVRTIVWVNCCTTAGVATAQDSFWVAPGVGNWYVGSNWSGGTPNVAVSAGINNGGTAQLFDPNAAAESLTLGALPSSSGTFEVLGGSAAISRVNVGSEGAGLMRILNGGTVVSTSNALYNCSVGVQSSAVGEVLVEGPGSLWNTSKALTLHIGENGRGTMTVRTDGTVFAKAGSIGEFGEGDVTVSAGAGSQARLEYSGNLNVGAYGEGTLSIEAGGVVQNVDAAIGQQSGGRGTVTLSGPGATWINTSVLAVGLQGSGTLNILNGGKVTSVNGRIARETGSTGSVTIDGPNSQWNCTGVFTIATVSGPASNGTLTLLDGGTVSALGGLTVSVGGKLQGTGVVAANVTNNWLVAPGTSPGGVLQVMGNYSQHTILGGLEIDLSSAASFDKLVVSGNATLAGGLRVALLGGYAPVAGDSFDILDWGTRTGTFSSLELPELPAPLSWNTSQLYTTGVLSVTGPYLAADFDENGVVNGNDLERWKNGFGTAMAASHMQGDANTDGRVDGADFLTWERQLGSSLSAPSHPVPEPGALPLLSGWAIATIRFTRRQKIQPQRDCCFR